MLVFNLIIFLAACLAILLSASYLVKSLSKIAGFLRIQEFTAGFIVMAIATSLPELFVGISSALKKNTALTMGNVIGANIIDLTIIAGIGIVLMRGYKIKTKETKKDAWFMIGFAALPILLMVLGREISRIDGIILLAAFLGYIARMLRKRKLYSRVCENYVTRPQIVLNTFLFIASGVVLFISAHYVVSFGTALAENLALPSILIGLFLISFATTLPELVFETTALLKGHSEMGLGDLIGSVITNSSLVLGISAIIYPISADFFLALTSGFFMIIVALIFATFVESNKLHWKAGISLILLYMFFVILEFFIKK